MTAFEVFDGYHSRPTNAMFVSIRQDGNFSLNNVAMKALRNPERVQLLYSRPTSKIGIRPASLDSNAAIDFIVRKQKNCRTCVVSGKAFFKEYNIDFGITRRFEARIQDEMLVIDLNGPSVTVSGPRQGKKVDSNIGSQKKEH